MPRPNLVPTTFHAMQVLRRHDKILRSAAIRRSNLLRKFSRQPFIVVIEQRNIPPHRATRANIPRLRPANGTRQRHKPHPPVPNRRHARLRRLIFAIEHHHHLKFDTLLHQRAHNRTSHQLRSPPSRNDNTNVDHHHLPRHSYSVTAAPQPPIQYTRRCTSTTGSNAPSPETIHRRCTLP